MLFIYTFWSKSTPISIDVPSKVIISFPEPSSSIANSGADITTCKV